jgi:hypothetical protein
LQTLALALALADTCMHDTCTCKVRTDTCMTLALARLCTLATLRWIQIPVTVSHALSRRSVLLPRQFQANSKRFKPKNNSKQEGSLRSAVAGAALTDKLTQICTDKAGEAASAKAGPTRKIGGCLPTAATVFLSRQSYPVTINRTDLERPLRQTRVKPVCRMLSLVNIYAFMHKCFSMNNLRQTSANPVKVSQTNPLLGFLKATRSSSPDFRR